MIQIGNFNSKARELLKFTALQYMLDAISENQRLGRIFVDDAENPNFCIVSFNHLLFCGGKPTQDCMHFLSNDIMEYKAKEKYKVLFIIYPDELWEAAIKESFTGRYRQYERSLYRHSMKNIGEIEKNDNIYEITSELMNSDIDNLEMITDEVISTGTYNDMDDYLGRGVGFTTIVNNKVWGFCTSEYPSQGAVAIGIEGLEEYQRQGYAKAMTRQFLRKAAERGFTVYWECWKNNKASINTALSCGFEKVADYPIFFITI